LSSPVKSDRYPNSRENVEVPAVEVIGVSFGGTPCFKFTYLFIYFFFLIFEFFFFFFFSIKSILCKVKKKEKSKTVP